MWDFVQDVRYGLRMMARAPVVMTVAALSLAVGIAANTTVFSVANGFLFEPFPFDDQDELVLATAIHESSTDDDYASAADYLDWRERARGFEDLVAYELLPANMTGGEEPLRVTLVSMTPTTLSLLGREPFLGRPLRPAEGRTGGERVIVLAHAFWLRALGGDPSVLGSQVVLDGESHTIVGVMPEHFDFVPANVDLFRPTHWEERRTDRATRSLFVMGRLAPGRTEEDARAELSAIASQLEREHPETNEGYGVRVRLLRESFPGPTDTRLMYILLAVASFVLLIACANVANLLLARSEARQREIAVRTALGAGRVRLLRQLLSESALLSLVGGALGTLGSIYFVEVVARSMPAELPAAFMPELDGTVLLYTLAISVAAAAVFGIAPALHSFGDDPRDALGENSRGGTASRKRSRLRSAFVIAEIALALALLVGAGVLRDVFRDLVMRDPGFDPDGILTMQLTVSEDRYPDDDAVRRFLEDALAGLREVAGVVSVAVMSQLPRSPELNESPFTFDHRPIPRPNEAPRAVWQPVNPGYFEALGVAILEGRSLTEADRDGRLRVAVVNESFVERYLGNEEPIGAAITLLGSSRRIVGVSRNVFQSRMPSEGGGMVPLVYLPFHQQPVRSMSFAMRTAGDPLSLGLAAREAVWEVDPDQPVTNVQTLTQHTDTQLSGPRILSLVLGLFGAAALGLAALGVYGVMAHSVVQRTRELGIRMALGAAGSDIERLVTREGLRLAVLGLLLGAPLAIGMIQAIRAVLVGLNVVGLALPVGVVGLLLVTALVATYLPARRAARIAPVRALLAE